MTTRATIIFTLLASFLSAGAAWAQEEEPPIIQHMEEMNDLLRQLRRQVRDPGNRDSILQMIASFRTHVEAARELQPLKTPELPESEREEFLKGYRETLGKVLSTLDDLKAAVEAGDVEKSNQLVRRLYDWKKEGHEKYQKEAETG